MIKMLVCLLLLLLAAGAGTVIYLSTMAPAPGETSVASVGKVRNSIYGAGRVEGLPETTLSFGFSGRVEKVNVKEGQEVVLNDTLAEMNPAEVQKQIKQAKAMLDEAEAELAYLKALPAPELVHKAKEKYEQDKLATKMAELKLDVLEHPPKSLPAKDWELAEADRAIKDAQNNLELAQIELKKLEEGPNKDDVEVAKRKVGAAVVERDNWKKQLEQFKGGASVPPIFPFNPQFKPTKADLEAALERAEEAVKVAEAEYDRVNRGPKPDDIKAQKVHVEMKKNAVEGAKAKKARLENPDPPPPALASEIKQAKLALEQAQTNERFAKEALDDAQRPPDPNKIRAAEAAREKREVELSSLNLHKEGFTLRAPFDGQITKKHYDAYATVPAYVPIVSMADFSHKRVRAEYDVAHLADIKPGMSVIIRSRSFNKEELEGKVLKEKWRIGARKIATEDPAAPKGGEIVEVLIEVEEPKSEAKKKLYDEVLQIGLPVDTEVVFEERLNVLRVPKSYVAQENGNPYVLLLERDRASGKTEAPRKRHVKCGLRDAQFVEIIEGLNDGDTIMKPKAKNER